MQISVKGALFAIGGALLAFGLFALKFIGMGEKLEKGKTLKAQQEIEHDSQEAQAREHAKSQQEITQAHADREHGDFDYLNNDKL